MKRLFAVPLAAIFTLATAAVTCTAAEFRVADFGAVGDGVRDDAPAIAAAFDAAKRCATGAVVVFEKKTYRLGDNPTAWHHFPLHNYSDLVIDGNGATLLCSDGNLGFHFNGGRNITVRGLSFDTITPAFTQGEVVAVEPGGTLDVKIMEGYPEPPDEAFLTANGYRAHGGGGRHMIIFENGGQARNTRMKRDHLYIRNITRVSPGVFRFHVKEDYLPSFADVAVGNWVTYGFNKATLPAAEKTAKDKSASIYAQIAADRVEDITFEDIDIIGSLNGGIRVSDMLGDVTLRDVRIIRKPGTCNLLSTISDALHLMNIRGHVVIEDCVVEASGDDCLNIGAQRDNIVKLAASDKRTVTLRSTDNWYYYYTIREGDRLQFLDTASKRVLGVRTVTAAAFNPRNRAHTVTLDQEVPGLSVETTQVMNLNQITQSTLIRNNTIAPYTRNAFLARAQNMTIEGNKLDCSRGGVIGLNLSYASGQDDARLRKVRVAGNTFICPGNVGLVALRAYRDEDGVPDTRDIKIIDNVFHVGSALAIRISGVQTLTSRGNTFKQNGIPVKDASRFTVISKCVDTMVEDLVQANIQWPTFLARHDMLWKRLPGNWREAPWTGNGMLGSMFWIENNALRIQAFRGDVQAHRPMTQGFSGYTRARLQIGSHYLALVGTPTACDLRLSYYDAAVVGTVNTERGAWKIRHFTHAADMAIVTELEAFDGEGPVQLTWQPDKNAMPTRPGYARTEEDLPRLQKQYKSRYPTEPFPPNPDAVVNSVDDVNICVQDMLAGSRHCTAWKMIETGKGKQRLVVSIGNRWPKETGDPVAEAVAAVKKVCALTGPDYSAWKQKHYDWWHDYYPVSFVSVPDTPVETVYWTTMYKLGSATRADRVMIDTAGIWQTPSRWADSHWDFNIPYCYYPMPTANRLHLAQSLIRNIGRHRDNLIRNVRPVEWQEDSSYLPVNTGLDLYQPMDIDARNFQNTGGHLVWAMHACWLIYRGSMDDDVLRETVYPILRRAANYQIHRLEKRDGKYHAPVSHSPEYGDAPDANYELSMLRWACHAVLAAGKRLGVEDAALARYRDVLTNLVDYPTDETGFMVGRGMPFNRNHRHWCHMQMMHPLQLVTGKTPAERELMEKSIRNFAEVNKGGRDIAPFQFTGTSAIWSLLGEGDKALGDLQRFMVNPINCPNSMNHYGGRNPCLETPVYAAQNVHEMLLQCYDEFSASGEMQATIRVFPAVPDKWPDAVFHNLRTAGAFLASAERKDGRTQWVRVQSLAGEPCRIKPNLPGHVRAAGKREFSLRDLGGVYELDLRQAEEALLYCGDTIPQPIVAPLPAQEGKRNRYGLDK